MSDSYRDKLKWKRHNIWRKLDNELRKEDLLRTQRDAIVDEKERLAGVPSYYWRKAFTNSTKWLRTNAHRRVRHHVKTICRLHQWRRLYGKDHYLKDYLD